MFKYLPDAKIAWREVWVGGVVTGLLFVAGKFAIGLYMGRSRPGDAFGAASALAIVLVWAYYTGMIVLFGAEFTQQWAKRQGNRIEPKEGAVRVIEREEHLRPGQYSGTRGGERPAASVPASDESGATRVAASGRRGGLGDYIMGLPIIYLLFRRARQERS
jgi:membrane protein